MGLNQINTSRLPVFLFISLGMKRVRSSFFASFATLALVACNEAPPPAAPSAPPREPTFTESARRADYDRGLEILAAIRKHAGSEMTLELTTELSFKCADLRGIEKSLAKESDPLVSRLVADIEKMCGLDVPLAAAQLEIAIIEDMQKRAHAAGETVDVKRECVGLKIAIGDFGAQYTSNPDVVTVGGKYATLCP